MRRHAVKGTRAMTAVATLLVLAACEPRRDSTDIAAGVEPFGELRGLGMKGLRAGAIRAFRANAVRAPNEGYRERIGEFDVVFAVPGYDGTDGSWPSEDALIEEIEATHEWPSDGSARSAFESATAEQVALTGTPPSCFTLEGPDRTIIVAEWDRGEGFVFTTSFAAADSAADAARTARHALAVRRRSLRIRFPEAIRANPDDLTTWRSTDCSPRE